MELAELGLIGNCQLSALVSRQGAIVWSCMPRFDSAPVFGALLDPGGGQFSITPSDRQPGHQRYLPNTPHITGCLEVKAFTVRHSIVL